MERFFIVKNEDLIKQVKEFESMRIKINDAFREFAKKHDIETTQYYQCTDQLRISPTLNDIEKFKEQLKVDRTSFKIKSAMNKEWVELCKANGLTTPENPSWELMLLVGISFVSFKWRLFTLNDKAYGSLEMDDSFELPEEHFIELKASEFYKIIEESQ